MKKLVAVILGCLTLTSCGKPIYTEMDGITGISHDGHGNITVHVVVCENTVSKIKLIGGFYDGPNGTNNPPLGTLESPTPQTDYFTVNLSNPAPWFYSEPPRIPTDPEKLLMPSPVVDDHGNRWIFGAAKIVDYTGLKMEEIYAAPPNMVVESRFESTPLVSTPEQFAAKQPHYCGENKI
ncbi:hypothetical protein QVA66_09730 [Staphylococcus chromogenes]|nr:hypothetical protein [Staphylococcus chromogenes]